MKITHLHSWEELPNGEEVAQDIHVDLQDYFTFELLYFCTMNTCLSFGRGGWIEGIEHIFRSF